VNSASETRVDFHTHSHYSDGLLSPTDLVERAAARNVRVLALTDHDTLSGLEEAAAACERAGITFVRGVEVSGSYRGQAIHVLGLGVAAEAPALQQHIDAITHRRRERIVEIGDRLAQRGRLPGRDMALRINTAHRSPTRLHIARELVSGGFADDTQHAFDRWLNRSKPGHVPIEWPALEPTLAALRTATPHIVLAHPHRYRLSAGGLRTLVGEFAAAGGIGLEASIAGMSPGDTDRIASLCRKFRLAASLGSDFHDPAVPWNPLGRWLKLADGLEPITDRFERAHVGN